MTEKLYYTDAYIKEFSSVVLSCEREGDVYVATLDKTAFFPNEGGQYADTGTLDGITVFDVRERDGLIYHYLKEPLSVGKSVIGIINFAERFEKMQCHTAEHIISGIVNRLFGLDNVGFHLGPDEVTLDFNGVLTREELDRVEDLVNEAIYRNLPVVADFPDPVQLSTLSYRSKLNLTENVRIVTVEEYDVCACCAPHVSRTGEIGIIKLLDFMKHKGGVRIFMKAGWRALRNYRERYANDYRISCLLSSPTAEIAEATERLNSENERLKYINRSLSLSLAVCRAESFTPEGHNAVLYFPDMDLEQLREFSRIATVRLEGVLVLLTGDKGDYKYVISSKKLKLKEKAREYNKALSGRGGGREELIQGSFSATLEEIKDYFK